MKTEPMIRSAAYRAARGLSASYMSALMRAMGKPKGTHFIQAAEADRWLREHPQFRMADIYPKKPKPEPLPA